MKINKIKEIINEYGFDHEIMLADGFDDALVGVGWAFDKSPSAVYDREKCIKILMKRDKCKREEAEDYFCYNVEGAFVGDRTPIFLVR
jgi:hypothetical protein